MTAETGAGQAGAVRLELAPEAITGRAVSGAIALLVRFGVLQVLSMAASIVLARLLYPSDYGAFMIVSTLTSFLNVVASAGLGAAAIQREAEPTRVELSTLFWSQFAASLALMLGVAAVAGPVAAHFELDGSGTWLFRVGALALPLAALRSVPATILERRLHYKRIAVVEIVEGAAFNVATIAGALAGYGVWALVGGLVFSRALGFLALLIASPWRPALAFDMAYLRQALPFGVGYQFPALTSQLKEIFNPIVVGLLVGPTGAGYLAWAIGFAALPLPLTAVLWRVTFATFSRLSANPQALSNAVGVSVRIASAAVLPISMLMIALAEPITLLVFDPRWEPAIPAFRLMLVSYWPGAILLSTLFNLLCAKGRPDIPAKFTVLWAVLDWVVGVPMVWLFGFEGVAIRSVVNAYLTLPWVLIVARRFVPLDLRRDVLPYMLGSLAAAGVAFLLMHVLPWSTVSLVLSGMVGLLVYTALAWPLLQRDVLPYVAWPEHLYIRRRLFDRVLARTLGRSP